jgi:hypothetical protein
MLGGQGGCRTGWSLAVSWGRSGVRRPQLFQLAPVYLGSRRYLGLRGYFGLRASYFGLRVATRFSGGC